jgi:hypothetical protein
MRRDHQGGHRLTCDEEESTLAASGWYELRSDEAFDTKPLCEQAYWSLFYTIYVYTKSRNRINYATHALEDEINKKVVEPLRRRILDRKRQK